MRPIVAFLSFCLAASPVSAQTIRYENDNAVRFIYDVVECIAKNELDAPIAREFLVKRFDPRDRDTYGKKLSSRLDCDSQDDGMAIEFGGDVFRYALASALVKRDYLSHPLTDFSAAPPLRHFQPASLEQVTSGLSGSKLTLEQRNYDRAMSIFMYSLFGECIARRSTVETVHLLEQPVNSTGEKRALQALTPTLIACGKIGKNAVFSQSWMRGAIALSYYRLSFSLDPRPLPIERKR